MDRKYKEKKRQLWNNEERKGFYGIIAKEIKGKKKLRGRRISVI